MSRNYIGKLMIDRIKQKIINKIKKKLEAKTLLAKLHFKDLLKLQPFE